MFPIVADPDLSSPHPLRRAEEARAQSEALRVQVAKVAEAVPEVEQEVARVHEDLADQGGSLAERAREHAERAREAAASEHAEMKRLRRAKLVVVSAWGSADSARHEDGSVPLAHRIGGAMVQLGGPWGTAPPLDIPAATGS